MNFYIVIISYILQNAEVICYRKFYLAEVLKHIWDRVNLVLTYGLNIKISVIHEEGL